MNNFTEDDFIDPRPDSDKLKLIAERRTRTHHQSQGYSRFIKWMKIVLPMIALCIVAVLFSWNKMSADKIIPAVEQASSTPTIGKNELANPRFESVDDKNQPYTITANRAVQGGNNEDFIILDEPTADVSLNAGGWLAIKANQGAFRQDSQRLLLKQNVMLFYDDGHSLEAQELDVDLKNNKAWTQQTVKGFGPRGLLSAVGGMEADSNEGTLIFKGPASLTLFKTSTSGGFNMETLSP